MTNPFLRPVSMKTYYLIERFKDIYWVKTGSHSKKVSIIYYSLHFGMSCKRAIIHNVYVKTKKGQMLCPYLKNKGSAVRFCLWPKQLMNI